MQNELTITEVIQLELTMAKAAYAHGLDNNKSINELKKLQERIDYIAELMEKIKNRYNVDSTQGSRATKV